jgi:hypothetical protein
MSGFMGEVAGGLGSLLLMLAGSLITQADIAHDLFEAMVRTEFDTRI